LHEKIHQLHNQLHPHHLPRAAEIDTKEEMDDDLKMEVAASEDKEGKGSSMDSDHSE